MGDDAEDGSEESEAGSDGVQDEDVGEGLDEGSGESGTCGETGDAKESVHICETEAEGEPRGKRVWSSRRLTERITEGGVGAAAPCAVAPHSEPHIAGKASDVGGEEIE